jgi:NADH-quinone oxidoreductase subunit M
VGEILVFVAAFRVDPVIGGFIVPGALLGAAYMFRVTLKMTWGEPSTAAGWKDLNKREWSYLVIPAVLIVVIGLAPGPFLRVIEPAANNLVTEYKARTAKTATVGCDAKDATRMHAAKAAVPLVVGPARQESPAFMTTAPAAQDALRPEGVRQ